MESRAHIFDEAAFLNKLFIFGVLDLINDYLRGVDPARLIHLKIVFVGVSDFSDAQLLSLARFDDVGGDCLGRLFASDRGGTLALATLLAPLRYREAAGRNSIIIGPFSIIK